jgi:pyroglutamyl-peptidase
VAKRDPVIVVTGFQPFGDYAVNPSEGLATAVEGRRFGACAVRSLIVPVVHTAAREMVDAVLADLEPVALVQLGLAGGRARIAVERLAVNVVDYAIPDARGAQPRGEPCVLGGPAAYLSTLPIREIVAALQAEAIPAYVSDSAGTYVCNQTMYGTLHAIAQRGGATRAGLIHVPLLPSMVAASGADSPSMGFALTLRAVETALTIVAQAVADASTPPGPPIVAGPDVRRSDDRDAASTRRRTSGSPAAPRP